MAERGPRGFPARISPHFSPLLLTGIAALRPATTATATAEPAASAERERARLQPDQSVDQRSVSELDGLGQREPPHLLALPRRRRRLDVLAQQQVPQVEVKVWASWMRIEVNQHRPGRGMPDRQAGLLYGLAHGRLPRRPPASTWPPGCSQPPR